jgi:hypothetical protein
MAVAAWSFFSSSDSAWRNTVRIPATIVVEVVVGALTAYSSWLKIKARLRRQKHEEAENRPK